MNPSIFLSHNKKDKGFVHRLARDLDCQGIKVWLDDAELKIGDSLIEILREAINSVNYVGVVLSANSINSKWVQKEIDVAMTLEINGKAIKVLPLMIEECDLPGFLLGKVYADFTCESSYSTSFELLVKSMGVVLNKSATINNTDSSNLAQAISEGSDQPLFYHSKPFHRPFQYIGMTLAEAGKAVGCMPNEAGNIVVDSDDCHMLLEAEGNFINYVEIDLKKTAPCSQSQGFYSEPILACLSINPTELDLVDKQTHYHRYYDHRRKLKIGVSCSFDGGPLSVGFSSKYYGM